MIVADGGELVILAPGVRAFGENEEMDAMTRKFGYKGRDYVLDLFNKGAFGTDKIMSAAHLIQGSTDGRFAVTYCTKPELMSKEEIESVGYQWANYDEISKRYDPHTLKEGWNTLPDGEETYFVRHSGRPVEVRRLRQYDRRKTAYENDIPLVRRGP